MNRKELLYSATVGAMAAMLASAGGQWAMARTSGPVNPVPLAAPVSAVPASFADIVQRVAPAVVSIDIVGKSSKSKVAFGGDSPFGGGDDEDVPPGSPPGFQQFFQQIPQQHPGPMHASGSGFFISGDGYIVTNNHVVDGADKITVRTTDERSLPAHVVGRDPETDLAVIKVEGRNFPFVSFEDRAKPRVGDWVVAVGNPFNLGGTATAGIVSAMARPRVSGSGYVDYMQIDAPINRGYSGGPTFDLYGRVVGVNSAIFTPSGGSVGIGFDIPADGAASVTRQLISSGKVVRGGLMHGKTSPVTHDGTGVFAGNPSPFIATRYHSLVVERSSMPDELAVTADTDDGVVMGLAHTRLPVHGVQFHPESVLTPHGQHLLANFLRAGTAHR